MIFPPYGNQIRAINTEALAQGKEDLPVERQEREI